MQRDWARAFVRKSLYKSSSFGERTLQERPDETLAVDLLNRWQEYRNRHEVGYVVFVLVASETSQLKSSHLLDDTFLLLFGSTADNAVLQKPFCAKKAVQLAGSYQTTLTVDYNMLESEAYPTNLMDFASVCYGIDHEASSMTSACVNGDYVENDCKCNYGFKGDRCQYSDLAELDCSPGFAKMSSSWEPICECPEPNGGRQYCGSPPCPGLCEQCSRRRGENICRVLGIEQTLAQDVILHGPTLILNDLSTTISPTDEVTTTTEEVTTTEAPEDAIEHIKGVFDLATRYLAS